MPWSRLTCSLFVAKVSDFSEESQQETVVKKMTTDNCMLEHYEVWDDGKDRKWILTFRVLDNYEIKPKLN